MLLGSQVRCTIAPPGACPRRPPKPSTKPKELMAARDGHRSSLRQLRCLPHQDGPSAGALIVAVCAAAIGRLMGGGRIIKVPHDGSCRFHVPKMHITLQVCSCACGPRTSEPPDSL